MLFWMLLLWSPFVLKKCSINNSLASLLRIKHVWYNLDSRKWDQQVGLRHLFVLTVGSVRKSADALQSWHDLKVRLEAKSSSETSLLRFLHFLNQTDGLLISDYHLLANVRHCCLEKQWRELSNFIFIYSLKLKRLKISKHFSCTHCK